jgi:hypothetical protein
MKSIDSEISEVERRLHAREVALKQEARELRTRGTKALMSPITIVAALAVGFVAAGTAARRKATAPIRYRDRRKQPEKDQAKGFAVGGLLMTAVTWLVKNQFGGPVGLARFVMSKTRKNEHRARTPGLRTGA